MGQQVCVGGGLVVDQGALTVDDRYKIGGVTAGTGGAVASRVFHAFEDLPGVSVWDETLTVANSSSYARTVMVRMTRPQVTLIAAQPNAVQLRDNWRVAVGPSPSAPYVSIEPEYQGVWTASVDLGTDEMGQPLDGSLAMRLGGGTVMEMREVPAGESLVIRWIGRAWTPDPWSDNANAGSPGCAIQTANWNMAGFLMGGVW